MRPRNHLQEAPTNGTQKGNVGRGVPSPPHGRFTFGPFVLDTRELTLEHEGRACRIQPQPLRVLALLVSRPGRLTTRERIRVAIWGDDLAVDHEHGLNFAINQIRTVLGDSAREPRYIETVPRAGYRFVAPVSRLPTLESGVMPALDLAEAGTVPEAEAEAEAEPESEIENAAPPASTAPTAPSGPTASTGESPPGQVNGAPALGTSSATTQGPTPAEADVRYLRSSVARTPFRLGKGSRRSWILLLTVALVAAVVGSVLVRQTVGPEPKDEPQASAGPGVAETAPIRLAVLPFEAAGADPSLAKGLTFDLIASLGSLAPDQVEVIGHRSMSQFRGGRIPASEIGDLLQVTYVVEGQVELEGPTKVENGRMRIKVVLIDTRDEVVRWSQTFDAKAIELDRVREQIAFSILEQLPAALPAPAPTPGSAPDSDPESSALPIDLDVYRLFADARWTISSGDGDHGQALSQLREVVRRAPRLASGHAALASALALSSFGSERDRIPEAFAEARAGLALDPDLAEAHFALGVLHAYADWNLEKGQRFLARALELEPGNALILAAQAGLMVSLGDRQAAASMSDLAVRLDPLSGNAWVDAAFADYLAGRFEVSRDRFERGLELGNSTVFFAAVYFLEASQAANDETAMERAVDHLVAAFELDGESLYQLPLEDRVRGVREAAIDWFEQRSSTNLFDYFIASQLAALGRNGEALHHLEQAHARRDFFLPLAPVDPAFAALRSEPRFERLVRRIHGERSERLTTSLDPVR